MTFATFISSVTRRLPVLRRAFCGSSSTAEHWLAAFIGLAVLAAAGLPAVALPDGYHSFADQRGWHGLPYAMDVLTNLPFAIMGSFLLYAVARARGHSSRVQHSLAYLTGVGLLFTALGSTIYHLQPDAAGLALDRTGMALVFAGVLGLAAATRVGDRAGWLLACSVGILAPLAAAWDWHAGNMTPWAVLQGGGFMLLVGLATRPTKVGAVPIALWPVLGLYALAKGLEMADAPVLALTQGIISGHSAKHLVAALALWPITHAFFDMARRGQAEAST